MATLYRNFRGRRELLEALFAHEVDDLCQAAGHLSGSPGEALVVWLRRFALFHHSKHPIASELLRHTDVAEPSSAAAAIVSWPPGDRCSSPRSRHTKFGPISGSTKC